MRISLSQSDFKKLVRGQTVFQNGAEIWLQDIGYDILLEELVQAYRDFLSGGRTGIHLTKYDSIDDLLNSLSS